MGGGLELSSSKQLKVNRPARELLWGSPVLAACHPPARKCVFLQDESWLVKLRLAKNTSYDNKCSSPFAPGGNSWTVWGRGLEKIGFIKFLHVWEEDSCLSNRNISPACDKWQKWAPKMWRSSLFLTTFYFPKWKKKKSNKTQKIFYISIVWHTYTRPTGREAEHFQRTFSGIPFWILSAVRLSQFVTVRSPTEWERISQLIPMKQLQTLVCYPNGSQVPRTRRRAKECWVGQRQSGPVLSPRASVTVMPVACSNT